MQGRPRNRAECQITHDLWCILVQIHRKPVSGVYAPGAGRQTLNGLQSQAIEGPEMGWPCIQSRLSGTESRHVIRYAMWLYFRFTLSIRDVGELLAQRGIEASREAVRCWVIKFGPLIPANLRRRRAAPTGRWHLDEMVVPIGGPRMYLWRGFKAVGMRSGACSNPFSVCADLNPQR